MSKIIGTFINPVRLTLKDEAYNLAIGLINKSVTGNSQANKLDKSGKLVPINPPEVDKKLGDAHASVRMSRIIFVEFDLCENGDLINFRIKDK